MNGLTIAKTSLDTAVAAKMIRKALKAEFPATKFSVSISRYSMGSSISIRYTNGPTTDTVEALAAGLVGSTHYDGQNESTEYGDSNMVMTADGPVVYRCGAYINATREIDDETAADFITRFVCENPDVSNCYGDTPVEIARNAMHKVAF
jgi:hypothetical protein